MFDPHRRARHLQRALAATRSRRARVEIEAALVLAMQDDQREAQDDADFEAYCERESAAWEQEHRV